MSDNSSGGGIGIAGILTIVFIVLKLTDTIAWNWFWVLSPLWISFCLWMLIAVPIMIWVSVKEGRKWKTHL